MSSSIAIPKRKQPRHHGYGYGASSSSSSSSYNSSVGHSSPQASSSVTAASSSLSSSVAAPAGRHQERRPSLLGSSFSKSEYTVINIGSPEMPRLITCVKSSQGFDWNQEMFLPSYIDCDSSDLERKADPVEDIVLTEEEAAAMLPQ